MDESFVLSGFVIGLGSALVGPALGDAHGWLAHVPHDLFLALPAAAIVAMMRGPDDVRDLGWSAGASLFGVAFGVVLLLAAGLH